MISQLRLAERLGAQGAEFLEWARSGLSAFARHAYCPETNMVRALFTDGTPLTPGDIKRPGYYLPHNFEPKPAGFMLLLSFALCHRLTGDEVLWETLRHMLRGHGLGDPGARPGKAMQLNRNTRCADPLALFGLLEMSHGPGGEGYLQMAKQIGSNLVATRFQNGLFVAEPDHLFAKFDALEPLALLTLEARRRGKPDIVPPYPGGLGYIHGPHDGVGRTYDYVTIWNRKRNVI
jgi:pectate lyase